MGRIGTNVGLQTNSLGSGAMPSSAMLTAGAPAPAPAPAPAAAPTPEEHAATPGVTAPRWAIGLLAGGAAAALSFTPSLLPRSRADQAVIAALSFGAAYAATTAVERAVDRADKQLPGGPITAHAAIAGATLALPLGVGTILHSHNPAALALGGLGMTIGAGATVGLIADLASTNLREARARNDAHGGVDELGAHPKVEDDGLLGTGISIKQAAIGAGLLAGTAAVLVARHKLAAKGAADLAAHMAAGAEPAGTLIPRTTIGKQGLKFVDNVASDPSFVKDPIRVYAGLASADSPAERAALVVRELERQGGLDRKFILIASPTGTGWVNNVPIAATEHFAKGDIASASIQYSTHASSLSLHRLGVATETNKELMEALTARIRELHPDGDGPKVLMYGESLGAWSAQRYYGANPSLFEQHGIFGTLWAGKPYHSRWTAAVRPDIAVDASTMEELAHLPAEKARSMRVLSYAQENDPVKYFNFASLIGEGPRPTPYDEPHLPLVRFFQGLGDMKNALPTQPAGHYVTRGHDYTGVYAELARRAFHFDEVRPQDVAEVVGKVAAQDRAYAARVSDAARTLASAAN